MRLIRTEQWTESDNLYNVNPKRHQHGCMHTYLRRKSNHELANPILDGSDQTQRSDAVPSWVQSHWPHLQGNLTPFLCLSHFQGRWYQPLQGRYWALVASIFWQTTAVFYKEAHPLFPLVVPVCTMPVNPMLMTPQSHCLIVQPLNSLSGQDPRLSTHRMSLWPVLPTVFSLFLTPLVCI